MVTTGSACSDSLQFFRAWAGDPLRVAAVAPSSRSLASLMTRELGRAQGPVIELGPGTGVFTRAMIERGVDESDLTLVERGPEFASMLRQRFPKARVMEIDAARLGRHALFHGAEAVAVVSGLPLLSMPPRKIMAIVAGAFGYIRPTGCFYQFTYGPRCPVPRPILDRLGLKAVRTGGTYRNLPPAAVYRLSRRGRQGKHRHGQSGHGEPRRLRPSCRMHPFARRLIPATNCGLGLAESISHPAASMLDAANISFHIGIR